MSINLERVSPDSVTTVRFDPFPTISFTESKGPWRVLGGLHDLHDRARAVAKNYRERPLLMAFLSGIHPEDFIDSVGKEAREATRDSDVFKSIKKLYAIRSELNSSKADLIERLTRVAWSVFSMMPRHFQESTKYEVWIHSGSPETYGDDFGGERFKADPFSDKARASLTFSFGSNWISFHKDDDDEHKIKTILHMMSQTFNPAERSKLRKLSYFFQLFHLDRSDERDRALTEAFLLLDPVIIERIKLEYSSFSSEDFGLFTNAFDRALRLVKCAL